MTFTGASRDRKPALIVIDMQNEFVGDDGYVLKAHGREPYTADEKNLSFGSCRRLIDTARAAGAPVIYVREFVRPDQLDSARPPFYDAANMTTPYLGEGTWGAEIVEDIRPLPDDLIVTRFGFSAFRFTHLDRLLRNMGVNTLVLAGGAVYGCVNSRLLSVAAAAEVLEEARGLDYGYHPNSDWRPLLDRSALVMIDLFVDCAVARSGRRQRGIAVAGGAIGGCVEDTILGGVALGYSMVAIEDACYRPDAGERLRMLEPKAFVITIDELMGASSPESAKLAAATA